MSYLISKTYRYKEALFVFSRHGVFKLCLKDLKLLGCKKLATDDGVSIEFIKNYRFKNYFVKNGVVRILFKGKMYALDLASLELKEDHQWGDVSLLIRL